MPNVFESEKPTPASLPVALNGMLDSAGDADEFRIVTEPATRYRIACFASVLGSPLDTRLTLFAADGDVVCSNDDWGSHDSSLEFVSGEGGEYVVRVEDRLGGGQPGAVYRLEAEELPASVAAFLPRPNRTSEHQQFIAVPQGNRALVRLAVRRNFVDGPARVRLIDPPNGVSLSGTIVPEDLFWVPAVIESDAKTPLGGQLCSMQAECGAGEDRVVGGFEQAVDLVAGTADTLFHGIRVDRVPVAVTRPLPFRIELSAPTAPLPIGGSLALLVKVERAEGCHEPVKVRLPFLPPWVTAESEIIVPGDVSEADYVLHAGFESEARSWPLVAVGEIDGASLADSDNETYIGETVASSLVQLELAPAPISGSLGVLAGELGTTLRVDGELQVATPDVGAMETKIEGLPNRIEQKSARFDPSAGRVQAEIVIADDAPLGAFPSVQVRLSGTVQGRAVSYVVAADSVLKVMKPGQLRRDAQGKLLSPLQMLQRKKRHDASR